MVLGESVVDEIEFASFDLFSDPWWRFAWLRTFSVHLTAAFTERYSHLCTERLGLAVSIICT